MGVAEGSRTPVVGSICTLWSCVCLGIVYYMHASLNSKAQHLLVMSFQPFVPPLLMAWLWLINVRHWELSKIEYESCFSSRDRKVLPAHKDLYKLAAAATAIVCTMAVAFCALASLQRYRQLEYILPLTYMGLALLLLLPAHVLARGSRALFVGTVWRVLLPLHEVTWSDFLLADIFTSLAKSCMDLERSLCHTATGPMLLSLPFVSHDERGTCNPIALPAMAALCLPYFIRFVQCLHVHHTTGATAQLYNALKYLTAFPALALTIAEHEYHVSGEPFPWRTTWLAASLLNSLYSFYWDVEQDWDMPWLVHPGGRRAAGGWLRLPAVRLDSQYQPRWYTWLVASNLLLRLSWTHRLLGDLEAHTVVALAVACLEVLRRFQWVYVRVETELRKLRSKASQDRLHLHADKD